MGLIRNSLVLKERRRELRRNQTDAEKTLWKELRGKRFQNLKFFASIASAPISWIFSVLRLKLQLNSMGGSMGI